MLVLLRFLTLRFSASRGNNMHGWYRRVAFLKESGIPGTFGQTDNVKSYMDLETIA